MKKFFILEALFYLSVIVFALLISTRPAHAFVYGANGCDQTTAYMGANMNVSTNCQSFSAAQAVCVASEGTGALMSAPGINPMTCQYSAAYPPNLYNYEAAASPNCVAPQYLDTASNTCVSRVYGSNGCDQTTAYMGSNPSTSPATAYCVSYAAARAVCVGAEGGQAVISANGIQPMTCQYTSAHPADYYFYELPAPPTCTAPQYLDTATNTCVSPPTCTAPQFLDNTTHTCVTPSGCPAVGTVVSSGYFDIGTSPDVRIQIGVCKNSCFASYAGDGVGFRRLVNGVYHYYHKGRYEAGGMACSGQPDLIISPLSVLGSDACASGQSSITMGGVTRCLDSSTGAQVASDSAAAVAAAKTAADAQIAKAVADAGAAAAAAGGSASDVQAAKTVAAAVFVAGGGSTQNHPDPVQAQFCKDNPTSALCSVQAKATGALPSNTNGSWYIKTYPTGIEGVMTANFNTMKTTPLFGLINNIVPTISGTAHNGCFTLPVWRMGSQQICLPSMVLNFLGLCMVLTALFVSRRIIFGG